MKKNTSVSTCFQVTRHTWYFSSYNTLVGGMKRTGVQTQRKGNMKNEQERIQNTPSLI